MSISIRTSLALLLFAASSVVIAESAQTDTATSSTDSSTESGDAQSAVSIAADSIEHNQATGVLSYSGNVRIEHQTLTINADRLAITENEAGNHIATVEGSPVSFHQNKNGKQISGQAQQGIYDVEAEILTLKNNAVVKQGADTVSGNQIVIDVNKGVATAGGKQQNGRVHTVIKAKSKGGTSQ